MTSSSSPPASDSRGADPALDGMLERVSAELVLAEERPRAGADDLEDLWTDPCHFLRRACQIADYGPTEAAGAPR